MKYDIVMQIRALAQKSGIEISENVVKDIHWINNETIPYIDGLNLYAIRKENDGRVIIHGTVRNGNEVNIEVLGNEFSIAYEDSDEFLLSKRNSDIFMMYKENDSWVSIEGNYNGPTEPDYKVKMYTGVEDNPLYTYKPVLIPDYEYKCSLSQDSNQTNIEFYPIGIGSLDMQFDNRYKKIATSSRLRMLTISSLMPAITKVKNEQLYGSLTDATLIAELNEFKAQLVKSIGPKK